MVAKLHQTIRNQRWDFFHKLRNRLIMQFDMMAVEDLHIKGLVQSNLAKSISDAAWGTFVNILTCKAAEAGRQVVKIPAAYTSQTCAMCGHRERKKLSDRQHICTHCGFNTHRDHNAALVILARTGPQLTPEISTHAL